MEQLNPIDKKGNGAAYISDCGLFRYTLDRVLGPGAPCIFIMLNPSTADANEDDPTIRRCIGFARTWGYGSLRVVNLFAYRATDPKQLKWAQDPVGPENDFQILRSCRYSALVVAAWGTHGILNGRNTAVLNMLAAEHLPIHCLKITKHGHPQHPLYLKTDLQPVRMPERSE